jgi:predicted DNA-binding antitoxin AbrB/MazE fold protein
LNYVDAIYDDGVFKPLEPVNLQNQQRVRLSIQTFDKEYVEQWLAEAQKLKDAIKKRVGVLPDSAPDIAADRLRDV